MKRLLIALAALLASLPAFAETFAWNNGSGGPVPDGTKLYCTTAKPYSATPSATVAFAQQTATITLMADVVPLTYTCVARHYKGSLESANSNEIMIAVAAVPVPEPQNFRLTGSLTRNPDGSWTAHLKAVPK